ncbi:YPK9 [Enterospora canceri]|uniref:YPK9 n=1 Tax=Enterospora canceri TaxID=1081671 RepID=A0A1Y1S924_9MICR|nr:YPK9 [Enterospora canceri]
MSVTKKITKSKTISFIAIKELSIVYQIILTVLTCSIYYVLCKLSKKAHLQFKYVNATFEKATHVILIDQYGNEELHSIHMLELYENNLDELSGLPLLKRYIDEKKGVAKILDTPYSRFIFDFKLNQFVSPDYSMKNIEQMSTLERRIIFGLNEIRVPVKTPLEIFEDNFFEIDFLWEMSVVVVWISIRFYIYAGVTGVIYMTLFFKSIYEEYMHNSKLKQEIRSTNKVKIHKRIENERGVVEYKAVSYKNIFPGDIILIEPTKTFRCDALLIHGDVITDETFLTGESVPICKGTNDIIYAGTRVIRSISNECNSKLKTRHSSKLVRVRNLMDDKKKHIVEKTEPESFEPALTTHRFAEGIVVKTGRRTKSGQLVKNMLIRKKPNNQFANDSFVISIYLMMATILVVLGFVTYMTQYVRFGLACVYCLDLLATVFSPSLVTCYCFGILRAISVLRGLGISCNDRDRIVISGSVDLCVFDKTGTLTEIGLEVKCVDTIDQKIREAGEFAQDSLAKLCMATCHQIVEINGEYSGDVLDMKMFLFTGAKLTETSNGITVEYVRNSANKTLLKECRNRNNTKEEQDYRVLVGESNMEEINLDELIETEYGRFRILHVFEFNSTLKRMSVIVRNELTGKHFVFCKGAPEIIAKCSTVIPAEFDTKNKQFGMRGYRTVVLAYKTIEEDDLDKMKQNRTMAEDGLIFLGFLVFANNLKKETKGVIRDLKNAGIASRMCTGDSILTAISVARESGMVPVDLPVIFPVINEESSTRNTKFLLDSFREEFDIEWVCVADDDYRFDRNKLELYSEYDDCTEIEYALAIEARDYDELINIDQYRKLILNKGIVFARFTPELKKHLVEQFDNRTTLFCGDGANDSGALGAADVGLLLSDGSNNLVSTFTAQSLNSVLDLIKEGKGALVTGLSQFKFVFYAQVLTGLAMLALLFDMNFPSDGCSLINDLLSLYGLANLLVLFKSSKVLNRHRPQVKIYMQIGRILAELFLIFLVYFITCRYFIKSPHMLSKLSESDSENQINEKSNQATLLFYVTMWLYLIKVCFFANYGAFKESRIRNTKFIIFLSISFGVMLFLCCDNLFDWNILYEKIELVKLTGNELIVFGVVFIICTAITLTFNCIDTNIIVTSH